MKKIRIIIFLILAFQAINSFSQPNPYSNENITRIDAYLNGPVTANICEGSVVFPGNHKPSKIKADLFIITFLNNIFKDNAKEESVVTGLQKAGQKRTTVKESASGLIKAMDILLKGNYLRAGIRIEFIDNVVIRTRVVLSTTTHARCGVYDNRMMDFKLVRDHFVREAELLFTIGYDEMIADTIYCTNLYSLTEKRKEYKFNIPGTASESWLNDLFVKQYRSDSSGIYNYQSAPEEFVRLVRENQLSVVRDLLYSPNYFMAVNAMEALIYLESVGKLELSPELNNRIAQIQSEPYIILQQGAPDVFYKRAGYRELGMDKERIIKKYRSSM